MVFDVIDVSTGHVPVTGKRLYRMPVVVEYVYQRLKNCKFVRKAKVFYNEEGEPCSVYLEMDLFKDYPIIRELQFHDVNFLNRTFTYLSEWENIVEDETDKRLLKECRNFVEIWIVYSEMKS